VHKFVDGNVSELMRYENNPGLEQNMVHTKEGDLFVLDDELNLDQEVLKKIELHPIYTPGHMSDHLCFLMKETKLDKVGTSVDKYSLFTGDHIVGASSTYFTDYPQYFESLIKTQKLINEYDVEYLYVAHSITLYSKDVALNAAAKNQQYISRRVKRDRFLESLAL